MTRMRAKLAILIACGLFSTNLLADEGKDMTQEVCKKIKTCGTAEIELQGIPPEMQQVMKNMLDSMCTSVVAPYVSQTLDAGLQSQAEACLTDIEAMACDELMNGGADNSEQCIEFEKAAKAAGIDTNTTTIIN